MVDPPFRKEEAVFAIDKPAALVFAEECVSLTYYQETEPLPDMFLAVDA